MNKFLILSFFFSHISIAQYNESYNSSYNSKNESVGQCPTGTVPFDVVSYDFESDQQGWVTLPLIGSFNSWSYIDPNAIPHSGEHSWRARNPSAVADMVLVSPTIELPINATPLTFQFWNKQEIENNDNNPSECFDGGILEISIDDAKSFIQIENQRLLTDPYDGKVATQHNNQIGGQDAWCGDPAEYINSIVDIDSFAGENIIFRFRLSSDTSEGRPGWDIDDVKVVGCMTTTDIIFASNFEEALPE